MKHLLRLLPVWLGISLLAFAVGDLLPGDPAEVLLQRRTGEPPTPAAVRRMRRELGLDAPLPARYARFVGAAVRGDLGRSYRTGNPVLRDLAERFPATAELALAALVAGLALSLPLGIAAAARRGSMLDHGLRVGALLGASLPGFFCAYLLIFVFAVGLGAFPVAGRGGFAHLVLPACTLALAFAASSMRLVRAAVLEELSEDYVRTARAKGVSEPMVLLRHALRGALVPIATLLGTRLGHLFAGAAIVETVFAWPGLGKYLVDSIYDRDGPAMQGFVLLAGTIFVLLNLAVDLSYPRIDPRIAPEESLG